MSYYLDFNGTSFLSETPSESSFYTVATPVPSFATQSKIYNLLIPFFRFNSTNDDLRTSKIVKSLKVITTLGAFLARIPLIPLSLNFHLEIPAIGKVIASCNIISFSSFLMWSSKDMIDHVFYSIKTSEHTQKKSLELCRKTAVIALSALSGLISQIPFIFLAWKYNPDNKVMVVLSGFDVIPPIYSLYLMLNHLLSKAVCSTTHQKLNKAKKYLLERLDLRLKEINNGQILDTEYDLFLQTDQTEAERISLFFSELIQDPIDVEKDNPCHDFIKMKIAQLVGSSLLLAQLFWTGFLSFQGANQLTQDKVTLGFIFVYTIVCNLALTRFVLINSTYRMLTSATLCFTKKRNYNYISQRLLPKSFYTLTALVLILAAASFIPAITLSIDFFDKEYTYISAVPYGLALVFMNYLPLKSLVNTTLCYGIQKFGSLENRKELQIYDHYKSVKRIIENSSPESLGVFLFKMCKDPVFARIIEKFDLIPNEISTYRIL